MLLVLTTVSPFWSVLSDYPEDDAVVLTPDGPLRRYTTTRDSTPTHSLLA
jgi:hypothetical protein